MRVGVFAGRRVALFGLGGSGLATARALIEGGAEVAAWDDAPASRDKAQALDVPIVDLHDVSFEGFAALVLAPGVPLTHPEPHWTATQARAAGIEIIGDVELFARERAASMPDAPLIAITGTNGKSTTTALIAHILRAAGRDVQMGGNIGTPVLALEPPSIDRVHVIECSSFQIDLAPSLSPSIGIHLNLTPDHLDRHGSIEAYAAIKERLVAHAKTAVIGVDDAWSAAMADRIAASGKPVLRISVERALDSGFDRDGTTIRLARQGRRTTLVDLAGNGALRGAHNAQNAAAAIATLLTLGLSIEDIRMGLASFGGLAHRMEQIGSVGGTLFINDSKATNADSTQKALASFSAGVHWIVGGVQKEGGIASLEPLFARVERAYLVGKSSDDFAATLEGKIPFERCGTIDVAVSAALAASAVSFAQEPVVVLSPACASYDQYPNFEVRGAAFRALVEALPGFVPIGR